MNDSLLAVALTGLMILAPVAAAQPTEVGLATADRADVAGLAPAESLESSHEPSDTATQTPEQHSSPPANESTLTATAPTDERPSPGAMLSGAVSAQGAEVENDLEERAFERRLNTSRNNRSKAAAIATRQTALSDRLATLRNRSVALERAHENGSIGEGRYRAQVTALTAQTTALQRQANRTERVADDLPREELDAAGVNVSAIRTLQHSASELSGEETRRIAQSIAGRDVGHSVAGDRRPDHAGPPEDRGRDGRSDDDTSDGNADGRDDRGEGGGQGPPDHSDRGRQNESDDRSDRDDRGRSGETGGNASDESASGGDGETDDGRRGNGNSGGADAGGESGNGGGADDRGNDGNGGDADENGSDRGQSDDRDDRGDGDDGDDGGGNDASDDRDNGAGDEERSGDGESDRGNRDAGENSGNDESDRGNGSDDSQGRGNGGGR
jgi:hypothetical protein